MSDDHKCIFKPFDGEIYRGDWESCKECGAIRPKTAASHQTGRANCSAVADGCTALVAEAKGCWIVAERNKLLELTRTMECHPEEYDGPCECQTCASYGD